LLDIDNKKVSINKILKIYKKIIKKIEILIIIKKIFNNIYKIEKKKKKKREIVKFP
jgi:hypothetical protein